MNRESEKAVLKEGLTAPVSNTIYVYGPRGTGKTVVTRHVVGKLPGPFEVCYLSCIKKNTQYRVLEEFHHKLSGERLGTGHHTSELKHRIDDHLEGRSTILILDEIDFLLQNDGNDLLYYLSRIESSHPLKCICISANHPDIASVTDNRTYSSLMPDYLNFEPYAKGEVKAIISEIVDASGYSREITNEALSYIASTTQNINFCLTWLEIAANTAEEEITKEVLEFVQLEANQLYQDIMLRGFSVHHSILLEAIAQLVSENGGVTQTGLVYSRYEDLCEAVKEDSLTPRQISDYLTHLALLGIIEVNFHRGGDRGKTRDIRIASVF